nr:uncharacterized protein LOC109147130 [Ipomoea batatas]
MFFENTSKSTLLINTQTDGGNIIVAMLKNKDYKVNDHGVEALAMDPRFQKEEKKEQREESQPHAVSEKGTRKKEIIGGLKPEKYATRSRFQDKTIHWFGTAERIWKVLKARFSEDDIFRVSAFHAEVHQVKQGDLSVSSYFAKLQVLWDELQAPHSEIILPVVAPIEDIIPPNVHSPNISPSTNNLADIPAVDTTEASQQEQQQLRRSSRQVSRPA